MRAAIVSLLLLFAFTAIAQRTVEGKIIDGSTKKPLYNIRVELINVKRDHSQKVVAFTYSDASGKYSIVSTPDPASKDTVFCIRVNAANYRTKNGKRYWTMMRPLNYDSANVLKMQARKYPHAVPDIHFKKNSSEEEKYFNGHDTISIKHCAELIADILYEKPMLVLEIQGYAELKERMTEQLAQQRAVKLHKMLEDLHVDMERVTVKVYGASLPPNQSVQVTKKENWRGKAKMYVMNRRVGSYITVDTARIPKTFKLEGIVLDCQNNIPVENVTVTINSSDGYVQEVKTDKAGFYSVTLWQNLSYVITTDAKTALKTTYAESYLNSNEKGKITTVGEKVSKTFKQDSCLVPARHCGPWFPAILFKHNSIEYSGANLDHHTTADSALLWLARTMKDNPTIVIEISAHGDIRESVRITELRAKKIADDLIKLGIEKGRLVPKGYGSKKQLVKAAEIQKLATKEEKEAAHAKNRRAVFKVLRWDYPASTNAIPPPVREKQYSEENDTLDGK